jgi:hypothetical protein
MADLTMCGRAAAARLGLCLLPARERRSLALRPVIVFDVNETLRDHGFRLFTLADNTLAISGRQLAAGGVIDLFERRFSVDETVRRHKPTAGHGQAAP